MNLAGDPHPKQQEFLEATEKNVAFGGGRGCGRSWAIRRVAIKYAMENEGSRVLIVKRTLPELTHAITIPIMKELEGIALHDIGGRLLALPSGGRILTNFCEAEEDVAKFRGDRFDLICIDDAQEFTESQLLLFQKISLYVRYSVCADVGESGYKYIKRVFVDRKYTAQERESDYRLIRSTVNDNPYIDKEYKETLLHLPEDLRRSYIDGEWI